MRIAIIEDEALTAEDLAETIVSIDPTIEITDILYSVEQAVDYFRNTKNTDLIFSDIQLGDGLSFDIFRRVAISTPVIFCTAYDEYALQAFKANGIDYILKPFTAKSIKEALDRYQSLKKDLSGNVEAYNLVAALLKKERPAQEAAVLVHFKEKILPIKTEEIALFYFENDMTRLVTFDQKVYPVSKTLEEIQKLAGDNFYRVNRQVLINRKSIKDASHYFHRKLVINLTIPFVYKEPITVSKLKVTHFLHWLSGA